MKSLVVLVGLLLGACAHLPPMVPVEGPRRAGLAADCQACFPQGRWQLVHAIAARLPGGRTATFTGVVVLSSIDASIHCVVMTPEGMVLFEAVAADRLEVRRALGPFDHPDFAEGMMEDLRFLFLEPRQGPVAVGHWRQGEQGCRYRTAAGGSLDLIPAAGGGWRMVQYGPSGAPQRSLWAMAGDGRHPATRMTLEAAGPRPYRLTLTLVEALRLP